MNCPRCNKPTAVCIGVDDHGERFQCRICTNEWSSAVAKPKLKAQKWELPAWAKDHKGPARMPDIRFDDRKPLPDIDVDLDYEGHMDWEYCECGCHTSDLEIAGMSFSHLMRWPMDKNDKYVDLHEGSHLNGKHLGRFKNFDEMDAFMASLLEERLALLQKQVIVARKAIKSRVKP